MNNRDFTAPYVFHEYPKWVTLADGSKALANNSDEEHILVGQHDDDQDRPVIEPAPVSPEAPAAEETVAPVQAEATAEPVKAETVEASPADAKPTTSRRRGTAAQADAAKE